jgi:hypothetical protein
VGGRATVSSGEHLTIGPLPTDRFELGVRMPFAGHDRAEDRHDIEVPGHDRAAAGPGSAVRGDRGIVPAARVIALRNRVEGLP